MWLEIKALISALSIIFIAIVIGFLLYVEGGMMLIFILFLAMILSVISDMLIGYVIVKNDLKPQMDTTPTGKEAMGLITLTHRFRIINTTKGPEGKREFRFNKQNASVINKGDYQLRLKNGNSFFLAHESYDENINLADAKYAEKLEKDFKTTDLKEIHSRIKIEAKETEEASNA